MWDTEKGKFGKLDGIAKHQTHEKQQKQTALTSWKTFLDTSQNTPFSSNYVAFTKQRKKHAVSNQFSKHIFLIELNYIHQN